MSNVRETKLWKENDWLRVFLAVLVIILLTIVYITLANWENIDVKWQSFALNIIANLIPTFVLFVGAYFFFRTSDELRSEKEADEIADKVVLRLIDTLAKAQQINPETSLQTTDTNPLDGKVRRELQISNKFFDDKSTPQKLIVQFTNRGNNIIHLKKVNYSQTGLGLPKDILLKSYRLDRNGYDLLIPVDTNYAEIIPGKSYSVEVCLEGKVSQDKINSWAGDWGYLRLELIYSDETVTVMYRI